MKTKVTLFVLACSLAVTGCTFPSSGRTLPRSAMGTMNSVDIGTVTSVRAINIEGKRTALGLLGGAVVGGAATIPHSGSTAAALGQAAGIVGGAIIGQAVEEVATRKKAQEISIRMDDGKTVVVYQETVLAFQDGDRVRVVHDGMGDARVSMVTD